MPDTAVVWFRRDLRVRENSALRAHDQAWSTAHLQRGQAHAAKL
jgi:deoxyribodipyrimidine photolyase